jgi:multidrug efflux system outer membrane protein
MRTLYFTRLSIAGVLTMLAAACAPAYQPSPVAVAPSHSVVANRAIASASSAPSAGVTSTVPAAPFWHDFGDTTLEQLVAEAIRANTEVHVAEARLMSSRASHRVAAFDLAPTITASGSALRQQQSVAQIPGLTSQLPRRDLYDVGFDAAWELDIFGRARKSINAQSAFVSSAEHALEDVQVSLASEIARSYFELRGAQRQLAVAKRNGENQARTVALTQDRLAAGRGTAFDIERARSVLQLTLAGIPLIEAQIAATQNHIAVLLGRAPDAAPAALLASGDLPRLPDSVNVGSPRELVRRRPDVMEAERRLAAYSLSVGAARAELFPTISLAASAGYAATRFESLTGPGNSRLLIGPVVSFPLLDIGRVRGRVDVAQAKQSEARAQYATTVLHAIEETESALVSYDRAHVRVGILTEAVSASTRASTLAQQRFEAGLTDFFQVLDAQRTLLDAENQLAQAHTAAATALVAVYKAVGGTWPTR